MFLECSWNLDIVCANCAGAVSLAVTGPEARPLDMLWFAVFHLYYSTTAVFQNTDNTVMTGGIVRVMNLTGMVIARPILPGLSFLHPA